VSLDLPASPTSEADLFARLGKAPPPSKRRPPPPPSAKADPDASSELELGMDDILEVAELNDFSNPSVEGAVEPAPESIEVTPVSVEPAIVAAPAPVVAAPAPVVAEPAPVAEPAAIAAPPAPNTSPIPLADLADDDKVADKTVQLRRDDVKKAAEMHLADEYEGIGHTEVMVRTPELANAKSSTQRSTTQPSAVHTPSQALNVTAPHGQRPSWQPHPAAGTQPIRRQPSIAPVAIDAAHRSVAPSMPVVIAPPQQRGMSAGPIAGLVFGAVALIGLVGAGGFAASRALSKDNTVASSEESPSTPGISTTTAATSTPAAAAPNVAAPAAPAEESAPSTASSPAPSTAGVDVSSLPSAAPKGVTAPAHTAAAAHTTTTSTSTATTAASAKTAKAAAASPTAASAQTTGSKIDPNAPLPPPGAQANANAPLPPPNAAPAAAPLAPPAAAPAQHSSLGTVRVDANLKVVQVDGAFRRAQDGAVTVSCGPHRIKAGMSERTIDVPCGGAVNF